MCRIIPLAYPFGSAMNASESLQQLLPHRPPMLMITQVIACDQEQIHCTARIQRENPLLVHGLFPALGGIELVAQAAGLLLATREATDGEAGPGAIAQIKTFQASEQAVPVGSLLDIQADFSGGNAAVAMFQGQVAMQQDILFIGTLMITLLPEQA